MPTQVDIASPFKILFVGDAQTGKTQLINKYVNDKFDDTYTPTIGADYFSKINVLYQKEKVFQMWDTTGQEEFRNSVIKDCYKGAHAIIIVFDITNEKSFKNVTNHLEAIKQSHEDIANLPIILVGNKSDLEERRQIFKVEIDDFIKESNFFYKETSAKNGTGVEQLFKEIPKLALEKIEDSLARPIIEKIITILNKYEKSISQRDREKVNELKSNNNALTSLASDLEVILPSGKHPNVRISNILNNIYSRLCEKEKAKSSEQIESPCNPIQNPSAPNSTELNRKLKEIKAYFERTNVPAHKKLSWQFNNLYPVLQSYIKVEMVTELKEILKIEPPRMSLSTLHDCIIKDKTRNILEINRQSKLEKGLKVAALITLIPAVILAIKRYRDTGYKSINFFQPLSHTVNKEVVKITTDPYKKKG